MDLDLLAFEEDLAAVGLVGAGDRLDERRLARAVVAYERDDLRGTDLDVDLRQRLHGAEALRDLLQLENRAAVLRRGGGGSCPAASFRLRSLLAQRTSPLVPLADVALRNALADLADPADPGQVDPPVLDQQAQVRLVDGLHRQDHRRDLARAVLHALVDPG